MRPNLRRPRSALQPQRAISMARITNWYCSTFFGGIFRAITRAGQDHTIGEARPVPRRKNQFRFIDGRARFEQDSRWQDRRVRRGSRIHRRSDAGGPMRTGRPFRSAPRATSEVIDHDGEKLRPSSIHSFRIAPPAWQDPPSREAAATG
jgi:hypothetical protein